ncbi:MAG: tRNA pseudouridine(55) synthase TruB [Chloroflexi bacterium]|nr:tRNA pseudouridine(55) synthase TruB [Chloroflexota bacterium]MBT3671137.1 tRNA pseudouridine(55) synthase TruB [Chloroflexota bacterium]MBT4534423.1 tRNA pseudouridine(55) synthase TruB [Chloroflexota bacterium]MBT4682606.1 tRNA pseudouridine(55) synthase TruB [Chloroflexota bacterium]MBT5336259.1 tRNA pseudouridine(55) synthase TruB [Chloroflexota bacterium]
MDNNDVKNVVSGVMVVDKPVGLTSHDVVQIIRRGTGIRRAGHTGTLDPRASGVLVILLGPAVRLSEFVSASNKRYQATIRLGSSTDTYDGEGEPTEEMPVNVDEEEFTKLIQGYVGEIEQVPPPYSAVKVDGKKAYEKARAGEEVELEPRIINVHNLDVLEWAPPEVVIDVHCSSGTYVRSLANDVGEELGIGAHLVGLRRTMSGQFSLRHSVSLRRLKEAFDSGTWAEFLVPAAEALGDWFTITMDADLMEKVRHGHRFPVEGDHTGWARAVSEQGDLVALLEVIEETNEWQPRKVFFTT